MNIFFSMPRTWIWVYPCTIKKCCNAFVKSIFICVANLRQQSHTKIAYIHSLKPTLAMTYKEAVKIISDNKKALDIYTMHDNPPHRILGNFIAPEQRDNKTEQHIYIECVNNHRSNDDVLVELNMYNSELTAFVVILMKGQEITMTLESYLTSFLSGNKDENIASE